jgi:DNA (cytosine-5)-methyltransferase 1
MSTRRTFYEFFAGGGMVRAGLGKTWQCIFANDFDEKKVAAYEMNWGRGSILHADVATLEADELPGRADLAWASFPCQDLSLAGAGAGLRGERSGTFWPFWKLIRLLSLDSRAPTLIALENVCGALTSHGGKDFAAIGAALTASGYRFGALVIDAVRFVPQSRPRLFIIGIRKEKAIPVALTANAPSGDWHTPSLVNAYRSLSARSKDAWVWWNPASPPRRTTVFADLIEDDPKGVDWHTSSETRHLLSLMGPLHRKKVEEAKLAKRRMVGGVYKRTRQNAEGERVVRAEIRFDDIAGCLRTPAGGSSRQSIMIVEQQKIRSRLLSPREAARLMGLPEAYKLPSNYNEAYHLAGDGVAVPAVRFLASKLFGPLLNTPEEEVKQAA